LPLIKTPFIQLLILEKNQTTAFMKTPLIGVSQSIKKIRALIRNVACAGLNVLICGESGVGKEVVAENLYHYSPRRGKPFVRVNCAALPEGLLESELFGYERGAFTGAKQRRRGKFELAHGGVLFLDEIGDMPVSLQSKLLHVLQNGEFAPLGSEKDYKSDTWVIAATNMAVDIEVKNGKFRQDLYYRINTINITIPPLRSRPEDIPHLINYYTKRYAAQFTGRKLSKPDQRVIEKLLTYHWPGNVRELQNVLNRFLVLGSWEKIFNELSIHGRSSNISTLSALPSNTFSIVADLLDFKGDNSPELVTFSLRKIKKEARDRIEKEVISNALHLTGWNRTKAAKILGISYRTLLNKIRDLNIKYASVRR
jgi:transcriptional regulator with GAF, ATPase, and Fis domain